MIQEDDRCKSWVIKPRILKLAWKDAAIVGNKVKTRFWNINHTNLRPVYFLPASHMNNFQYISIS